MQDSRWGLLPKKTVQGGRSLENSTGKSYTQLIDCQVAALLLSRTFGVPLEPERVFPMCIEFNFPQVCKKSLVIWFRGNIKIKSINL